MDRGDPQANPVVPAGDTLLVEYRYDGLHQRLARLAPSAYDGNKFPSAYTRTDYYHSLDWQVVEERRAADVTPAAKETSAPATAVKYQYVWDPGYVDALICRDEDVSNGSGGDPDGDCTDSDDRHLHYCQDANWNVTALVDAADGAVVERYLYDPYGQPTVLGGVRDAAAGATTDWSGPRTANTFSNEILFCGYRYDPVTGLYHVRNRDEHPTLGRWIQTDPALVGPNLYEYCLSSPAGRSDPTGLDPPISDADRLSQWQTQLSAAAVLGISTMQDVANLADLVDALVDKSAPPKKAVDKLSKHHLLPQAPEFAEHWQRARLNIEDFTIMMRTRQHRLLPNGLHTGRGVENWNGEWRAFFNSNPFATKDEILDQLLMMCRKAFG